MKRIVYTALMMLILMFTTSCVDNEPKFSFNLEVMGEIQDDSSNIKTTFSANVMNVNLQTLAVSDEEPTLEKQQEMNDWFDDYCIDYINQVTSASTLYNITMTGFVHEEKTGITMMVNKTFTNTIEMAIILEECY